MKAKLKKLTVLFVSLVFLCSLSVPVYAHDVPDMDRLGSITVTVRKGGVAVSGGTLTLYRVGEVSENDGNYTFQPAGEFAACGESFENLESAAGIAARLKSFAADNHIAGMDTRTIGADGTVTFSDLPVGLYLIAQNKAAPGYAACAPFLVSLPYMENGTYLYDITADPKTDLELEPEPTDPPPTKPADPSLPQTGQMNWPIPLLSVLGMGFFAIGWFLVFGKRKSNET